MYFFLREAAGAWGGNMLMKLSWVDFFAAIL